MTTPKLDERSPERRARDEQIDAEPRMPPLELPPDAPATPVETHLDRQRRHPVAIVGVVENGLVRRARSCGEITGTLAGHYCGV